MRRVLLSPGWLIGHLLAIGCVVAFLRLGWWQWDVAHRGRGGPQNYGYALQWPLFAFFVAFVWVRIVRDAVRAPAAAQRADAADRSGGPTAPVRPAAPPPAPAAVAPGDDEDEELAAYNRYLAWLHTRDEQRSAGGST